MSVQGACSDCGKTGDPTDPADGFEDCSYFDGKSGRDVFRFLCPTCYREMVDEAILQVPE